MVVVAVIRISFVLQRIQKNTYEHKCPERRDVARRKVIRKIPASLCEAGTSQPFIEAESSCITNDDHATRMVSPAGMLMMLTVQERFVSRMCK